jgi:hypothetical protein
MVTHLEAGSASLLSRDLLIVHGGSQCSTGRHSGSRSDVSGWHARGQGFDRPCRARPADRSLVAEDRSAEGVRDQTGPEAPMLTELLTGRAAPPRDERVQG